MSQLRWYDNFDVQREKLKSFWTGFLVGCISVFGVLWTIGWLMGL